MCAVTAGDSRSARLSPKKGAWFRVFVCFGSCGCVLFGCLCVFVCLLVPLLVCWFRCLFARWSVRLVVCFACVLADLYVYV